MDEREGRDCRGGRENGGSEKTSSEWQLHEFISDVVIIFRANDAGSNLGLDTQTFASGNYEKTSSFCQLT
ncbi:hypothetical protein PSCICF_27360 [Pseudomonas cichorii]|nr:hypothetical protein PSCICF_27360 [Pseudomonas cichorii]